MTTAAISGVGTLFKREAVTIAEINSITGPGMTRATIDVTSLDSTGGYREFITGFRDGGTVVLNMNYKKSNYDVMMSDFESNSTVSYSIVLNDTGASQLDFEGLVTELPLTIPLDDKITMVVTIKITGAVTFTS